MFSNKFKDNFTYLGEVAKNISLLRGKINSVLNKELPGRILSKANIFNLSIDIVQDLTQLILLQIEDALVEQNMVTAQKELSVRGLSTLTGHQAVRPISADGVLKFMVLPSAYQKSPILVFQDLILKCEENGLMYMAKNEYFTINNSMNSFVPVIEGRWVKSEIKANGDKLEIINLDDTSAIENNHIRITVNSDKFTKFDSLYDMKSTDKGFLVKNGIGNQVDIIFGDGIHGVQLKQGDSVTIEHLVTNGEMGNIENLKNSKFQIVSGAYDINGYSINLNDDIKIVANNGFALGSNGEDIEVTRQIAGYSSRAMVFTKPENLKAYLMRLSILSYVDVWTDLDNNIYNILCLPNITKKIGQYKDILTMNSLLLDDNQKNSIIEYIQGSNAQQTSTEILWVDPKFMKYVTFIYVTGNIMDKQAFKNKVENAISEVFITETFLGNTNQNLITQNMIVDKIINLDNVTQCNIDIFSEENEIARINGKYVKNEIIESGATKQIVPVEIVLNGENPNLGFDELGAILPNEKHQIPLLKGGFLKYDTDGNHAMLEKPIYIFYKNPNGDFESIN